MNKIKSLLVAAALMLSFTVVAPTVSAHEGHDHPKKTKKKKSAKSSKKRAKKTATVAAHAADGHKH